MIEPFMMLQNYQPMVVSKWHPEFGFAFSAVHPGQLLKLICFFPFFFPCTVHGHVFQHQSSDFGRGPVSKKTVAGKQTYSHSMRAVIKATVVLNEHSQTWYCLSTKL